MDTLRRLGIMFLIAAGVFGLIGVVSSGNPLLAVNALSIPLAGLGVLLLAIFYWATGSLRPYNDSE